MGVTFGDAEGGQFSRPVGAASGLRANHASAGWLLCGLSRKEPQLLPSWSIQLVVGFPTRRALGYKQGQLRSWGSPSVLLIPMQGPCLVTWLASYAFLGWQASGTALSHVLAHVGGHGTLTSRTGLCRAQAPALPCDRPGSCPDPPAYSEGAGWTAASPPNRARPRTRGLTRKPCPHLLL